MLSLKEHDNNHVKIEPNIHKICKKNILEEISSFDGSYIDCPSECSDDEKNYETLKGMMGEMKD